jgi:hypothetical protein
VSKFVKEPKLATAKKESSAVPANLSFAEKIRMLQEKFGGIR